MALEPLDLEPIKARLAAATPGSWVWLDHASIPEHALDATNWDGSPHSWGGRFSIEAEPPADADWPDEGREVVFVLGPIEDADDNTIVYEIPISDEDAALVINAPADLAALVAEVERLRALAEQGTGA